MFDNLLEFRQNKIGGVLVRCQFYFVGCVKRTSNAQPAR